MCAHFIDDLVPLVIECGDRWWPRDLASLCRVSPSWMYPARRMLYRCPQLTGYRACSLLARSLRENEQLRALIKGIGLRPMPDYSNHMRQAVCVDSLRTILATEGLRSITLGGELSIAAGRFLHMVTNPATVVELHIDGGLMMDALQPSPSLEWDEDIAAKFAKLRTLRLSRLVLSIDLDGNEMSGQMIRTLVMDGVEISQGQLSMLAGGVVEHLEVSGGNAGEQEEEVREMLVRGVRTVRYRVCGGYESARGVFGRTMEQLPLLRGIMAEGVEVDEGTVRRRCPGLEWLLDAWLSIEY